VALDYKNSSIARNFSICILSVVTLLRSRTLVYGFAIGSFGTYLIASGIKIPDFFVVGRLLISVYFLALATYLYNDLTDYKVDHINNRKIVYNSKETHYRTMLYSTIGFFVISTLLAFSINILTGICALAFLGLAIAYSHPRTHFKDRFMVKTLVTALGASIASIMGLLAAENFSYLALVSSIVPFLFYFILGPLGDIGDMRGDKAGGRRTIPIMVGIPKTFVFTGIIVSCIASMILASYYFLGINIISVIFGISLCTYAFFKIKKLSKQYEDKKKISQVRTMLRYSIFAIQIILLMGTVNV